MPTCRLCGNECESKDHPGVPRPDGTVDYCCDSCYEGLVDSARFLDRTASLRCDGCGAAWGAGCSCPDNLRAIAEGERAKAREEEAC